MMQWIRKHLDELLVVSYFSLPLLEFPIFVFSMWCINNLEPGFMYWTIGSLLTLANFAPIILFVLMSAWSLRLKNRSYRWLFVLLVPIVGGYLIPFIRNKNLERPASLNS